VFQKGNISSTATEQYYYFPIARIHIHLRNKLIPFLNNFSSIYTYYNHQCDDFIVT